MIYKEKIFCTYSNHPATMQRQERSGTPAKFSMEQVVGLFAIACSEPEDYGRPISDWTARELAEEMVKQNIVESISRLPT